MRVSTTTVGRGHYRRVVDTTVGRSWTLACEEWALEGEYRGQFVPLYSFTLEGRHRIDYEVANHYTSTHPASGFKRGFIVQRVTPQGRLVLRGTQLTRRTGSDEEVLAIRNGRDLVEVLASDFGLDVPEAEALVG